MAGPWPRPTARRLCPFVLVSSGRRVSRDLVSEELFADLDPRAAARAISKALSMARAALAGFPALLEADLTHIWAATDVTIDAEVHEAALDISPGHERAIIEPEQQWLPDALESALAEAIASWDGGYHALAAERLAAAVTLARELRYA